MESTRQLLDISPPGPSGIMGATTPHERSSGSVDRPKKKARPRRNPIMTPKKSGKPRRNPSTSSRKPATRGKTSKAAKLLRGKASTRSTKPEVPKPVGRRTDKNRRIAEEMVRIFKKIAEMGGIDDVFHRLPD